MRRIILVPEIESIAIIMQVKKFKIHLSGSYTCTRLPVQSGTTRIISGQVSLENMQII